MTAEATAVEAVRGMPAPAATRVLRALTAAQELHQGFVRHAEALSALTVDPIDRYPGRHDIDDLDLVNALDDLDGTLILQGLLMEIRQVIDFAIGPREDDEHLGAMLAELTTADEVRKALDDLRTGPLGQAALAGIRSGVGNPTPEHRVTGTDGKNYPDSAASAADQRIRILALRREHPDWSARRIAREVGCSQNTVGAVAETLAETAS